MFEQIYNALIECKTKHELVDTLNAYSIRTTTSPTDTKNTSDLYIQLCDKSRLMFTKTDIKVYTNETHANAMTTALKMIFGKVNDGSYRTQRANVPKTVENFKMIFEYFANANCIEKLPKPIA